MTTIPHQPTSLVRKSVWFDARDLWATLAIVVIWLAVLFVGVFGPDFVARSNDGNATVIPSGIGVAVLRLVRNDVRREVRVHEAERLRLRGMPRGARRQAADQS
jgi:hypothetical protein